MTDNHLPMQCKDRYCSQHRDIWHHYEDEIAPRMKGELTAEQKQELYSMPTKTDA